MSDNENNLISEDVVQVNFFSSLGNQDNEFWQNLVEQINTTLKTLSRDYIWHRDEFNVFIPIFSDTDGMPMHLSSTVCFGDNIEDEWFIVYLTMELSKRFNDLIIQIIDNDGDFLLIEAANYLPSWANPENTENRVFILNNAVHIIPPHFADLNDKIKVTDALQILQKFPGQTKVSPDIEKAIQARVGQYPEKIENNFHRAIINLPLDIAALLNLNPSLIAPIVTAYCKHDVIDAKSCRNLKYSDNISVEVKFTKCLYAMLVHSQVLKKIKNTCPNENKKDILGIKLTCGFQMIMNLGSKDIFQTKEYLKFEKNLQGNGYFRNNIEGSLEYNQLQDKARKYYLDIECPMNSFVSNKILKLMATDEFLHTKETLKCRQDEQNFTEDNDDWLNIHPDQLNDLLNNRYGHPDKCSTDDVITPEVITTKLTDFLKQSSDFEGIDTNKIDDNDNSINLDPDEFVHCLDKIMDFLSSDMNDINMHNDSDLDNRSDTSDDDNSIKDLDKELAGKLNSFQENRSNSKTVMFNLSQSMKEEGLSGPSSNLLTTIGIHKTDILDSDDD